MAHAMERYFTHTEDVDFTDRMLEAVLKTIIKHTPMALKEPENYGSKSPDHVGRNGSPW